MKKIFVVAAIILMMGCSVSQKNLRVDISPEVRRFLSSTNLIFSDDFYWIKSLPGPSFEIGSVYEKIFSSQSSAHSLIK